MISPSSLLSRSIHQNIQAAERKRRRREGRRRLPRFVVYLVSPHCSLRWDSNTERHFTTYPVQIERPPLRSTRDHVTSGFPRLRKLILPVFCLVQLDWQPLLDSERSIRPNTPFHTSYRTLEIHTIPYINCTPHNNKNNNELRSRRKLHNTHLTDKRTSRWTYGRFHIYNALFHSAPIETHTQKKNIPSCPVNYNWNIQRFPSAIPPLAHTEMAVIVDPVLVEFVKSVTIPLQRTDQSMFYLYPMYHSRIAI